MKDLEWVARRALAHESVVEQFIRSPALLPMQLFTIFTSDERARAHVSRDRGRIDRILQRIEGHVEFGVRLTWDEQAVRAAVERAHAPAGAGRKSGAAYLARKRDLLEVGRTQLAGARGLATGAHGDLSRHARDAVRRTETEQAAPGSRLLLDAAYLVPTARSAAFRSAARRTARALARDGITLAVTGPWPPYNFVSAA